METKLEPDLTPFIEAAKRGCEWFFVDDKGNTWFRRDCGMDYFVIPKMAWWNNHIAACVCIEWWNEWAWSEWKFEEGHAIANERYALANLMIDKLRAFKREYGTA